MKSLVSKKYRDKGGKYYILIFHFYDNVKAIDKIFYSV